MRKGPDIVMQRRAFATFSGVQVYIPLAAAPHATPQISGTHVTGFMSCSLTFHLSSFSTDAPFIPKSCLMFPPSEPPSSTPDVACSSSWAALVRSPSGFRLALLAWRHHLERRDTAGRFWDFGLEDAAARLAEGPTPLRCPATPLVTTTIAHCVLRVAHTRPATPRSANGLCLDHSPRRISPLEKQ